MEFKIITSLQNPKIKDIVRLRDSKGREETGLTLIDGVREIRRAIDAGVSFTELFLCREVLGDYEEFDLVKKFLLMRKPVYEAPAGVFNKIIYGNRNEGVLAVCKQPKKNLEAINLSKQPLIIIVESVEKPGNLGAILRSADAAGVDAVLITDTKTDLYNPNVIRSSIGTVFNVSSVVTNNEGALKFIKSNNIKIFAASPEASMLYVEADFRKPTAIILGSEEAGLSIFWKDHADYKMKIPMRGKGDSLNVSSTAAILVYEALRQRGKYKKGLEN
ncbi:MAG: RNA methyltransferase [Candidatus Omnitrophica bacterium]|nr:RNA methyltransferase [Candidatus Omnitrophota bacterium]